MVTGEILSETNEWVLVLSFLALVAVASEAGFRLGRRHGKQTSEETKSRISTVEGGILGVLGLLLGFTMSMAVTRFEARKQLVLQEANAIGTAHLRTQMLPAAEGKEIADLLLAYANVRVPPEDGHSIYEKIASARQESARLQDTFWRRAVAYAQKEPFRASLLLQSLNQLIELDSARWMAFQNHVPETVIFAIVVVGLLAAMVVGYTFGMGGFRQLFSICALSLAITLVLTVIIDLDRPQEGFIRVSQQPMLDLQKQLHSR
jgi:CDP-diglyceride synthetase